MCGQKRSFLKTKRKKNTNPQPKTNSSVSVKQDNKKMKKSLEEEQRARKDLEKLVRKVLKNMNDPSWDETNL